MNVSIATKPIMINTTLDSKPFYQLCQRIHESNNVYRYFVPSGAFGLEHREITEEEFNKYLGAM